MNTVSYYLSNVRSPQIRSIIAKYRLDVNNTYMITNSEVSDVKILPATYVDFIIVRQSVKHILLECSFRNLERKREVFCENYKKYLQVTLSS